MPTQLQLRRGSSSDMSSFTGAEGELTVNTTNKSLHLHDGSTSGGIEFARADLSNSTGSWTLSDGTNTSAIVIGNDTLTVNGTTNQIDVVVGTDSLTLSTPDSGVTAASYGSSTAIPVITVDAKGRVTAVSTASITAGGAADTDELSEGSSNLYFTNARADARITAALIDEDNFSSNSATRLPSQQSVKAYVDGTSYLTGSDGVSVSAGVLTADSTVVRTSGPQTIAGAKTYSDDAVFNGNVTISGTQTIVNSQITSLADNIIELNRDASGTPTEDAGISVNRGSAADVALIWDESEGYWAFTNDGTNYTEIGSGGGIALTDISVGAAAPASGDGAVAYDNSTGVFTYTPPAATTSFNNTTLDGITTLSTSTEKTSLPEFDIGSVFAEQAKIQASDVGADDRFGHSVSISSDGNTAIVGAWYEDTGATDAGAAYIFTKSGATWSQQAKIQATDKELGDTFGSSVSISSDGNTAIVGAYLEDTGGTNAGAAYIFTRSGTSWSQQAKIQATDKESSDFFGYSVSISGDGNTVLVGAYAEDTGDTNAGAAYIFTRSGTSWSQQAKIQSSDIEAADSFGNSVSISSDGNTVLVGASSEDTGATEAGAAYVFVISGVTWTQQAKIQSSDIEADDNFGHSVSISGDGNTAIVGSKNEDTGGTSAGAAYIFTRSGTTWTQQAKIQATDKEAGDNFGMAVSISVGGNTAIVGAWVEDTGGENAGAAYIFEKSGSTWTEMQKIQASDKQASDYFGYSVSISGNGNVTIVGAYTEDTGASNAGAAYIYEAEISSIVLHDISQSSIFSHSGLTENITANFTNVPTTNDRTLSVALIISQGATGYLPTAVQIDGAAQTILWQGASAPTSTPSATDIASFTLIRSAGAWTVLGTVTAFGSV